MWHALRGNLAFFLVGAILGACIVTVAVPQKSASTDELQMIELDTMRNAEKIELLNKQVQAILDWISEEDKQKIHDAEVMGGIRITIANHEKLVWMAFANLVAITILLGRHVLIHSKKDK